MFLLRISGQLEGSRVEDFPERIIRGEIAGGYTVPPSEFFVQQFVIRWIGKEVFGAHRNAGKDPLFQ